MKPMRRLQVEDRRHKQGFTDELYIMNVHSKARVPSSLAVLKIMYVVIFLFITMDLAYNVLLVE